MARDWVALTNPQELTQEEFAEKIADTGLSAEDLAEVGIDAERR